MIRVLSRKEKERYIGLFNDEEYINYLKSKLNQKWYLEFVFDNDFDKCKAYLYSGEDKHDIDDELTMFGYMRVYYARNKYELVEQAKDYQSLFANGVSMGWGDIDYFGDYFTTLGKRFGCLKEFRENGII